MHIARTILKVIVLSSLVSFVGCSSGEPSTTVDAESTSDTQPEGAASDATPAEEGEPDPGTDAVVEEESDGRLGVAESYEGMHRGVRLRLAYDTESNAFKGTVENMMRDQMKEVVVKVDLSEGVELTTTIESIEPGSGSNVVLDTEGAEVDRWTASAAPGGEEEAAPAPSAGETP